LVFAYRTNGGGLNRQLSQGTQASVSGNLPFVVTYESDGWAALGEPTRRAIVAHLAERPRAVGELARELPVSRPAVSQHLKVLKEAGLVTDNHDGTRRIYRVNPDGVAALRAQLDSFWTQALANFKDAAEQATDEEEK
jgi:DNA-binding transcriptional ArsR family regulator